MGQAIATLRHFPLLAHLRAVPNEYALHYRCGRLVAHGAGPAFAAAARVAAEKWRFEPLATEGGAGAARFYLVRFVFDAPKPGGVDPLLGPPLPVVPGDVAPWSSKAAFGG